MGKITLFSLFLISLLLIVGNAEAGWKFWKKKSNDATTTTTTTTAAYIMPNGNLPTSTVAPGAPTSRMHTNTAIARAGEPGLAVGLPSAGDQVRNSARPKAPNPGTEVGLDISVPRPRPGIGNSRDNEGYRNWAAELAGADRPSQGATSTRRPQLPPGQGGGHGPPSPGSRVSSPSMPNSNAGSQPSQPAPRPVPGSNPPTASPRPASGSAQPVPLPGSAQPIPLPAGPQPGRQSPSGVAQPAPQQTGNQVSTLHVTLRPGIAPMPIPNQPGPNSPNTPNSSNGMKSWADIAGGDSRSRSSPQPPRQPSSGHVQPRPQEAPRPGPTRSSTNVGPAAVGGALAGSALAGSALAGSALAGTTRTGGMASGGATTSPVYSSNPTYSKGNTITDDDLEKLAEALYIKDTNNANRYVTLNLQKKTTSSSPTDEAPQPLLTVSPEAFQIPTIQRVISIFDNYQLETHTNEYISPAQREEESLLVDTFLSTNVMSAAMRFLADKGRVRKDYYEYKDTLRRLWFNLFSRGEGKIGSTGFEHVFMTELKPGTSGTEVIGLHNWIYFNAEETKRRADYLGYIHKVDLGNKGSIVKIHVKFNGFDKPVTTMFVGTSPELEMALYTVCFFAREGQNCPVSLGGTKFNIVTHKFRYRGKDLIGTAYPDI